jgi:hypothetical protein
MDQTEEESEGRRCSCRRPLPTMGSR